MPFDLFGRRGLAVIVSSLLAATTAFCQAPPYDVYPDAEPPYYRVRYEASDKPGELIFPVKYTVWIPPGVETLRGVVVHQHGCGEGSCKSGLTGAFDLHWQALAKKHHCALLAPSYEQPQDAECQMWCDPRNGSDAAFQRSLSDLGAMSGHPELATVPWVLWGHSGGGHWCGGMVMLHPERVAAAWLRSGVPFLEADPERDRIKPHKLPSAALAVPIMCNPGTKEGVTVKTGRFARVWPANKTFFETVRGQGGLIGIAVDPLTAHECGNSRYLAIPWLDTCLTARLPDQPGASLKAMPTGDSWLAYVLAAKAVHVDGYEGDIRKAIWLPDEATAKKWMQFVVDTNVEDTTPPPAPANVTFSDGVLTWDCEADLESGIGHFVIERDGEAVATVPEKPTNRFGRPLFQGLQYSDTPAQPLVPMSWTAPEGREDTSPAYSVRSVNTVGLRSTTTPAN